MPARRSPRRKGRERGRRGAWLAALVVVLAIGAVLWTLRPGDRIAPPMDEHDASSRARLEALLREAEREPSAP